MMAVLSDNSLKQLIGDNFIKTSCFSCLFLFDAVFETGICHPD